MNAIDEYAALIGQIHNAALCITAWADDHGELNPEEINWSHVGSAQKILDDLREIARFAGIQLKDV